MREDAAQVETVEAHAAAMDEKRARKEPWSCWLKRWTLAELAAELARLKGLALQVAKDAAGKVGGWFEVEQKGPYDSTGHSPKWNDAGPLTYQMVITARKEHVQSGFPGYAKPAAELDVVDCPGEAEGSKNCRSLRGVPVRRYEFVMMLPDPSCCPKVKMEWQTYFEDGEPAQALTGIGEQGVGHDGKVVYHFDSLVNKRATDLYYSNGEWQVGPDRSASYARIKSLQNCPAGLTSKDKIIRIKCEP